MSVIPLTLTISLCLVFTFVLFFLREHSRQRFSSAESDALLPLADETPRPVGVARDKAGRDQDTTAAQRNRRSGQSGANGTSSS
ncbi:hypothetical protein [Actomonas aquatica]|uniref:Cbb3-type cytochrome oxidase assembly protein CcoS n=1 Tax=Actomonas aquatica TaxID=2866162 RepID=A0ABZ1C7F7_9BACT|nr:hypothetical protein [Opitutus sp. WL0086]WRQ87363.1 hypothetical protein K1X11_021325 [Opitutus sp. WL0086]